MGCKLSRVCFRALFVVVVTLLGTAVSSDAQVRLPRRVDTQPKKIDHKVPDKPVEVIKPDIKVDPGRVIQPARPAMPTRLLVGDFTLTVESYSAEGKIDTAQKQVTGVSGTGWVTFDGKHASGTKLSIVDSILGQPEKRVLQIVEKVTEPSKQITLADAKLVQPNAKIGGRIEVESKKGDARLRFENATIAEVPGKAGVGRITNGSAAYPCEPRFPDRIKLSVNGFTIIISALALSPKAATANVTLQLPKGIGSTTECGQVSVALGEVNISPDAEFYVQKTNQAYGPWIIGDTDLAASGTGIVADFSPSQSPSPHPASWKGLTLGGGTALSITPIPSKCNTGYLGAKYSFGSAAITQTGFKGQLGFSDAVTYVTSNPANYSITADGGSLSIVDGKIASGQIGPGKIALPAEAVCKSNSAGHRIGASYTTLKIQDDMDLAGEVAFAAGTAAGWGELTHSGHEVVPWTVEIAQGVLYLPAGPRRSFSADSGGGFVSVSLSGPLADVLAGMETAGMTGVAIRSGDMGNIAIYSPDLPGYETTPLKLKKVDGWMRVGHIGVDANLRVMDFQSMQNVAMGSLARPGYIGKTPFAGTLNPWEKERPIPLQFVCSAAYDSHAAGAVKLPMPCNIPKLEFSNMRFTSTANMVGGEIALPAGGVPLDYWKLQLVPTGTSPAQSGVISVRTGQIVMTAAGIEEKVHFAQPFKLTWGQMLANGNLGQLFFDYNSYGQKFDTVAYSPEHVSLSEYQPGRTDGYLATCGSLFFNFFGCAYANIHDARDDGHSGEPHLGRYVTVPKPAECPTCKPTDLHLQGKWADPKGDDLAAFDFPNDTVNYNEVLQRGFIGTGTARVAFLGSQPLDATIETRGDNIDVCMNSGAPRDVDLGLASKLGAIGSIYGCARIVGPTMQRMAVGGLLERASGDGLLMPKTGAVVEVVASVSPDDMIFNISGDMLMALATTAVEVSGNAFLKRDFTRSSVEGDVEARIDCNSVMSGLEGDGQLTWYADPATQYLQGRVAVNVCSWLGKGGMEGGLFIGHNVPKAKAWVLQTSNGRFGVSQAQLPDPMTGLYGYGQMSFGVNYYVFGGGIALYAGMGAFTVAPPGCSSAWTAETGIGLPYVLGNAGVEVHGEILGGLVSASGWANLTMGGPIPVTFEGRFGLEACVAWVLCGSVEVTAGLNSGGFYLN